MTLTADTSSSECDVVSYQWYQVSGDVETPVGTDSATYTLPGTLQPGVYTYACVVVCQSGCSARDDATVTVYALPTASFDTNRISGTRPLDVRFDDHSIPPVGGTIVLWEWNFDSDPEIERTDYSAPATFTRTFSSTGTYLVRLTVTDDHGCSDTATTTITVTAPRGGGGGSTWEPGDPQCFFDVDMLGEVTRIWVTCDDGRCLADYEPEDPDDENFLELAKDTRVTYEKDGEFNGGPPRWIRMTEAKSTPAFPKGTVGLTHVYDFLGYTATGLAVDSVFFDRPVGMLLDYDPDSLPETTVSVGIAVWDSENNEWIIQPQSTGQVAGVGTATADVMHFSKFVVLATTEGTAEKTETVAPSSTEETQPANYTGSDLIVEPAVETLWGPLAFVTKTGHTVTVTATIANTGQESGVYAAELTLNGETVGTQDVTLAGGEAKQVRFVVSNVSSGEYIVQVAGLEDSFQATQVINWLLILLLVAVLAVPIALLLHAERRRRRTSGEAQG